MPPKKRFRPIPLLLTVLIPLGLSCQASAHEFGRDGDEYESDLIGGVGLTLMSTESTGSSSVFGPYGTVAFRLTRDQLFTQIEGSASVLSGGEVQPTWLTFGLSTGYIFESRKLRVWLGLAYESLKADDLESTVSGKIGIGKMLGHSRFEIAAEGSFRTFSQKYNGVETNYPSPAATLLLNYKLPL